MMNSCLFYSKKISLVLLMSGVALTRADNVNWNVHPVNPWVSLDAKELADNIPSAIATQVVLSGPRNDWVTGALLLSAKERESIELSLEVDPRIAGKLELRLVGIYQDPYLLKKGTSLVYSPLLSEENIKSWAKKPAFPRCENLPNLTNFPTVVATPEMPVFLWLTADFRSVQSGTYGASISFTDTDGRKEIIPIHIEVLDAELPVENPLHFLGWQWAHKNTGKFNELWEHGVNVIWTTVTDAAMAWEQSKGQAFFVFIFQPSWSNKPFTEEKKKECIVFLDALKQRMAALGIPKTHWAVTPLDEVTDSKVEISTQYTRFIKELDPEVLIMHDPAWVVDPETKEQVTTTLKTFKMLEPYTDIWCPYSWHFSDPVIRDYLAQSGKTLWTYDIYSSGQKNDGVAWHRMGSWFAWKHNLSGFGNFSLDTFNDNGMDYACTFPGYGATIHGGILSTRAFEALRQGIQEYKRLKLLRELGVPEKQLQKWAEDALSADAPRGWKTDGETLDRIRAEMDQKLVELLKIKVKH